MTHLRGIVLLSLAIVGLVLFNGCESQATKAQNLLSQGQYQQVIDQFPDTQYARRAEVFLAEQLLEDGKYDEVMEKFPNTPSAYTAKLAQAQRLFDAGDYNGVMENFPHSPLAMQAEQIVTDSLYNAGAFDELIEKFPGSGKAKLVQEARAEDAFEKAKKLKGKAKKEALEEITQKYRGTKIFKDAMTMLRDLRN